MRVLFRTYIRCCGVSVSPVCICAVFGMKEVEGVVLLEGYKD